MVYNEVQTREDCTGRTCHRIHVDRQSRRQLRLLSLVEMTRGDLQMCQSELTSVAGERLLSTQRNRHPPGLPLASELTKTFSLELLSDPQAMPLVLPSSRKKLPEGLCYLRSWVLRPDVTEVTSHSPHFAKASMPSIGYKQGHVHFYWGSSSISA